MSEKGADPLTGQREERRTDQRTEQRAVRSIVAAIGTTSVTVGIWVPFMPLYMLEVGARDAADAAFWVAVAIAAQGISRLVAAPLWGVVSDRVGRKKMFVRALFFSALSTGLAAMMQAPWQLCVALVVHGLFSGVVPSATALLSVSVPDSRIKSALGNLSGVQYIGMACGPAIGGLLAVVVGYRGAFAAAAALVVVVGFIVLRSVPQDEFHAQRDASGAKIDLPRFQPSGQLLLGIFVSFVLFALQQLRNVAAPLALLRLDSANAATLTGIAFTIGGLASIAGIVMINRWFQKVPVRRLMIAASVLAGASHLLLALSSTPAAFIAGFALCSVLHATLFPLANTLIALNVERARRGTAFGLANGVQAMSMVAGPMGAALITATSFAVGFSVLGALLLGLAALLGFALREPKSA